MKYWQNISRNKLQYHLKTISHQKFQCKMLFNLDQVIENYEKTFIICVKENSSDNLIIFCAAFIRTSCCYVTQTI